MTQLIEKILEPRAGLEPATCRLRKDLTLRMLLWSIGAFEVVLERFRVF